MKEHKVKVYSTPSCPWCNIAKEFLKKNNISFEEIDVSQDMVAAQEMMNKSGQMGVPVIEIDGQMIVGFDEQKLKKLLEIEN
jgi:glutaredoxin-like YruB-family protein